MNKWILAARPKTLTAAIVPIVVATALSFKLIGVVDWIVSLLALGSSLFIQIGTNLVNDAMDFKKGADTEDRIGPKRITVSGEASANKVLIFAGVSFLLAALLGIPLVLKGGLPIMFVGLFSILCGYAYTSGPMPLAYKGLGELFVILFFGIIAVTGIEFLQTEKVSLFGLIAGLQVGLFSTVLIAINNFRDFEGDRKANKMTLAARFGPSFARWEIAMLILFGFLINIFWIVTDFLYAGLAPFIIAPLGLKIIKYFKSANPSPEFNSYLAKSSALYLLFGALFAIGMVVS